MALKRIAENSAAVAFLSARQRTEELIQGLSPEDCTVQSMPDASPLKWHLAHTSWFFETFILKKFEKDFKPFHPKFEFLFNSYYNSVGSFFPRNQRGLLTRPSLEEVLQYRQEITDRMNWLLENSSDPEVFNLTEVGLHHEQQHQELMLTDLKHLFFQNPLFPKHSWNSPSLLAQALSPRWISFAAGVYEMGAGPENGFAFDNEKPLHRQFLESFDMAQSLVQNQSYLEFMQDDGYSRPELWLSEGWDWRQRNSISHPLYWVFQDENWFEYSLNWGLQPLHPNRPVLHLSFFEADAFARWSKARLPTEFEWELAARSGHLQQAHDVAWQWTQSSYSPYPGFQTNPGALGEYNGKFMINQYVLRGSSIATPCGHSRHTYRNFFPTHTRWQWTGIRLARSNL